MKRKERRKKTDWCPGGDKQRQEKWKGKQTRGHIRCSFCGKRYAPRAVYCVGGEFVGMAVPPHKAFA